MATTIIGVLVGVGTAAGVGGGGTAAAIAGGLAIAASAASTGVGIASAAGAFDPEVPNAIAPPRIDDPQIDEARRLQRAAASRAKGRKSTIHAGGLGPEEDNPALARPSASAGPGGPAGI